MRIRLKHKPPNAFMGRFGGGWQWKLGFQAARGTLIISLLVFDIRIDWSKT